MTRRLRLYAKLYKSMCLTLYLHFLHLFYYSLLWIYVLKSYYHSRPPMWVLDRFIETMTISVHLGMTISPVSACGEIYIFNSWRRL